MILLECLFDLKYLHNISIQIPQVFLIISEFDELQKFGIYADRYELFCFRHILYFA